MKFTSFLIQKTSRNLKINILLVCFLLSIHSLQSLPTDPLSPNQYTFARKIYLYPKIPLAKRFISTGQQTIAIQYQSSQYDDFEFKSRILSGQNYEQLIKQIQFILDQNNSVPKYSATQIFINRNSLGLQIKDIDRSINVTINPDNSFYKDMIVTQEYILVHDVNKCPILKKTDLKTFKVTKFQYQDGQNCTYDSGPAPGLLSIIPQTQQIIYGSQFYLYILDSKTLQKKQRLIETAKYQYTDFNLIKTCFNATSKISYVLIKGSDYKYETFYSSYQTNNTYVQGGRFYTAEQQFKLFNENQGYTILENKLYSWRNIFNQTVYVSFDVKVDPYLWNTQIIGAIDNGNKFLAVKDSFNIQIYEIDYNTINYNVTKLSSTSISINLQTKRQISSDQKMMFGYNFRNHKLIIFYIETLTYVNITGASSQSIYESILDYALFNTDFNKFLTIVQRQTTFENQTTIVEIFVQIRKLDTPTTVDRQYKIQNPTQFEDRVYGYKIITHPNWGLKFVMLFQRSSKASQDAWAKLCKVQNLSIICQENITTTEILFKTFQTTSRYILTRSINSYLEFRVIDVLDNPFTRVYSKNFSYPFQIMQAKDKVLICQNSQINSYDFSSKVVQEWWIGRFFRQYWKGLPFKNKKGFIIPQKGLLYIYSYGAGGTDLPMKAIYDINYPPVYKSIQFTSDQTQILKSPTFIYKHFIQNSTCNLILYVEQKVNRSTQGSTYSYFLHKYINCQSYNKTQSYELSVPQITATIFLNEAKIFEVSNTKYVIVYYIYAVEIRQLDKLQSIVFRQIPISILSAAQITKQGLVILKYQRGLRIFTLPNNIFPNTYGIVNISSYDVSQNSRCMAFGGQSVSNNVSIALQNTTSSTVYLRIMNNSKVQGKDQNQAQQNYKVKILTNQFLNKQAGLSIDNQCKRLIIVSYEASEPTKNKIQILNIQDPKTVKTINQYNLNGAIQEIRFIQNNTKFMIKMNNDVFVSFDVNPPVIQNDQKQFLQRFSGQDRAQLIETIIENKIVKLAQHTAPYPIISAINAHGQQYAITTQTSNYTFVQIYNSKGQKIGQFAPQMLKYAKIIGLSFNSLNQLLVLDDGSNIYVINHKECPLTFINLNGYCLCQEGEYKTGSQCMQCSMWCVQCDGEGLSCLSYSKWFYLIIIGGSVLLLLIIITVIVVIKKKSKSKSKERLLSEGTTNNDLIRSDKEQINSNL